MKAVMDEISEKKENAAFFCQQAYVHYTNNKSIAQY